MQIRNYVSKVLDGMAKGLFASLIIGVIIKQFGTYLNLSFLVTIGQTAQFMMGPCIGAGVAFALGCKNFTLLSAIAAGAIGAGCVKLGDSAAVISVGEPIGALAASWISIEIGKKLEGHTKFDLLLVPAAVILVGGIIGTYFSPAVSELLKRLGEAINELTSLHPLPMGILLAVIVGCILTLPISSAALCIAINIDGLAAGAALAGCCAQMIGFAVMSFRENKYGGLVAQGIGTSMIQMPNIIKNPWIWLPPTIASAICGPIATLVFKMETNSVGAGMGTSGLVGQFTTVSVMGVGSLIPIAFLHFLLPAAISLAICEMMRKANIIKPGDLQL